MSSWFGLKSSTVDVKCRSGHLHTECNSFLVNFTNFIFTLIALLHLAFLGSAFDGNEANANLNYVIDIWSYLRFYSHGLFLIMLVVYKLL
jgi:hypothetical protein